jgi:hypothetical protein
LSTLSQKIIEKRLTDRLGVLETRMHCGGHEFGQVTCISRDAVLAKIAFKPKIIEIIVDPNLKLRRRTH